MVDNLTTRIKQAARILDQRFDDRQIDPEGDPGDHT